VGPCDPCAWTGLDARRGPVEIRDLYVMAQPRLTLPSIGPDTLGCGATTVRGCFHWSNSFGVVAEGVEGEDPPGKRFIADGETRTLDVEATHGVRRDLDVAFRVPLHWRGGGVLDSMIDEFHELTEPIGVLNNDRPLFFQDKFRVNGRTTDGGTFSWDDEKGIGLGDVEASAKWRFLDGGREGWSLAAVLRLTLPTSTGPFEAGGLGVGAQVVTAKRLGRRFDVFAGVGATAQTDDEVDGVHYVPVRGHAFAALEWRPWRAWSVVVSGDAATRLVDDVVDFAGEHVYLHMDVKVDLSPRTRLELGFTENIEDQQTTADFGMHFGLTVRL